MKEAIVAGEVIRGVFNLILMPQGVLLACGGIIVLALISAIVFFCRISPIENLLKEAIKVIDKAKDELGFVKIYQELEEWIKKSKILSICWDEFTETLIFPDKPQSSIRNTFPAENYFNEETLINPYLNIRFYNNWPNILTGLGILGTFIGLVAGIYMSTSGGTINEDSIKKLIDGAALAFSTSIAGILSSIIFSWFEKHHLNRVSNLIHSWNNALDTRLERVTSEGLAIKSLEELKSQSQELKMFNTELAFNIANALDEKMSGNLIPTLQDLIVAVEGLRKDRADTNDKMLKEIVKEFIATLQGAAGEEMKELGTSIKSLNEMMVKQQGKLSEAQDKMQGETKRSVEIRSKSLEKLNQTVENIGLTSEAMNDTAKSFVGVTTMLQESFNQLETVSRRLENVVIGLARVA